MYQPSRGRGVPLVLAFFTLAASGYAQTTFGTISGRISDATGAVLANAKVSLTNNRTAVKREAITNSEGLYRALNLDLGQYTITVEADGFRKAQREGIEVNVSASVQVDFTLQLAATQTTVEVSAEAATVNTTSPELASTLDTKNVNELPLNGRDFTRLALFTPGALATGSGVATLAFNGSTSVQNNFTLDGVDATRIDNAYQSNGWERGSRLQTASVESVEEFRVLTSNYSAEYGRAAGAIINAVTKSGGSIFHGSAYGFFRNDALNARNFFDPSTKPSYNLQQFGGALGGPVLKNKLFFFTNYEGSRKGLGATTTGTTLTDSFKATVNPVLKPILDVLPKAATVNPTNPSLGTFSYSEQTDVREDIGSFKADYKPGDKDSLYVRYNIGNSLVDGPLYVVTTSAQAGQRQYAPIQTMGVSAPWVHIFRPDLTNELKFGLNRFASTVDQLDPRASVTLPQTTITGITVVPGVSGGFQENNTSLEFFDNVSWFHGKHSVKAGINVRRVLINLYNAPTTALVYPSLAAFAANQPTQATYTPEVPMDPIRGWNHGVFLQDDIRLSTRLTLNVGVRWEYTPPWTDTQGRLRNFDLASYTLAAAGKQLYRPDKNNWAPRFGFAYDLDGKGKTVIRAGAGVFYQVYPGQSAYQLLFGNGPGAATLSSVNVPNLSYPLPDLSSSSSTAPPSRRAIDVNRRDNYTYQYNLSIQRQIAASTSVQVGYVGSISRNLERNRPLNLIDPATNTRPNPAFSTITYVENTGLSSYNALQASLNRRFSKGFSVNLNYAFSKELDNAVSPQNPLRWDLEWSQGAISVPHNTSFNAIWELPFGKGRAHLNNGGKLLQGVLGGWQVNAIGLLRSGLPYTVTMGSTSQVAAGWLTNQRPDAVAGVSTVGSAKSGPNGWLNPAAYALPAVGRYGSLGRNTERGPKFTQIDASAIKGFKITERQNLQFRAEAFNLGNTPIFGLPTSNFRAPATFGNIYSTFGTTEQYGTARQFQLALRYSF